MSELRERIEQMHCINGADLKHLPQPGVCLSTRCDKCSLLRLLAAPAVAETLTDQMISEAINVACHERGNKFFIKLAELLNAALAAQAPKPADTLDEATASVSKWPEKIKEYSEQHPFTAPKPSTRQEHPQLGVHLSHCNFGEHVNACKYGEDDCPSLTEAWSWFGKALQRVDSFSAYANCGPEELRAVAPASLSTGRLEGLRKDHNYPERWDLATCIAADLEDSGIVEPGRPGILAQQVIAKWLEAALKDLPAATSCDVYTELCKPETDIKLRLDCVLDLGHKGQHAYALPVMPQRDSDKPATTEQPAPGVKDA
jgi:hypothetical protein